MNHKTKTGSAALPCPTPECSERVDNYFRPVQSCWRKTPTELQPQNQTNIYTHPRPEYIESPKIQHHPTHTQDIINYIAEYMPGQNNTTGQNKCKITDWKCSFWTLASHSQHSRFLPSGLTELLSWNGKALCRQHFWAPLQTLNTRQLI